MLAYSLPECLGCHTQKYFLINYNFLQNKSGWIVPILKAELNTLVKIVDIRLFGAVKYTFL